MGLIGEIAESLGELVAPTRCAGCERQGALFCRDCLGQLSVSYVPGQACAKCAGPYGALTCTECWELEYSFERVLALGILDGPLARAVVLYKDSNERRLADLLGAVLAVRISEEWSGWADVVCGVPASKEALRRRGFDHGELLANSVARHLSVLAMQLLERPHARRDQRDLSRKQRLKGSQQFRCRKEQDHPPERILLVDDVFTTGGTAESATTALLKAGAKEVRLAVLGRAW